MGIRLFISALCVIPHVGMAAELSCFGQSPDWWLTTDGDAATFSMDRISNMQIMQDDTAVGDPSTRAMTVIGPRDSAIVVITQNACQTATSVAPFQATVLTQRGQTPIVLSGCCTKTDPPAPAE